MPHVYSPTSRKNMAFSLGEILDDVCLNAVDATTGKYICTICVLTKHGIVTRNGVRAKILDAGYNDSDLAFDPFGAVYINTEDAKG